ncbi:MAG: ATP-binding protein [Nitrospirae bacterium]|nr:ATP-binding protein [Nitrospirota bacterium]
MRPGLGLRLLGLLIAGVILSCGVLTYLIVRREKALLIGLNQKTSALLADSITTDLKAAMLEEDPAGVKRMLNGHKGLEGVRTSVFGSDGSLVYGDSDFGIPHDMFSSLKETLIERKDSLIFLKPLLNETACHKCHGVRDRLRGVVAVSLSTRKVAREVDATAEHMAVFAFLTAFLSGTSLIFVLRKMVLTPLTVIRDGSVRLRDGNLGHRIEVDRKDEFGTLAIAFNQMAGTIEAAQRGLEEAVHRRTKELRVVAELSQDVFRGDRTLKEIIGRFLVPVTRDLGYSFCALCLIDKETGTLHGEYERGTGDVFCSHVITLADDHPFTRILREAKPVIKRTGDVDLLLPPAHLAIVPLVSHRKRRCRDINVCTLSSCPAFDHADERCWLVADTLCRSPHSVRGKNKIFGCLHCEVFPLSGVLIVGDEREMGKSSLHSLEILASEIESAIENHAMIHEKKKDIQNLIRLHDTSVERIASVFMQELTASIVSAAASFANADAALLWLVKGADSLALQNSSLPDIGLIPLALSISGSFVGRSLIEARPLETVNTADVGCLDDLIAAHHFLYAATVPLKTKEAPIGCLTLLKKNDFFMTDSEKAIVTLFASQASAAITTARIYEELKAQKEFSEAIFNGALSGVMVLDGQGRVMKINQAGRDILQLDEDLSGQDITEIHPETRKMLLLAGISGKEVTITLKKGETRPIGFSNSPLIDKNGEEKGIIVVFRDLTEIKELQIQLRRKQHFDAMAKVISGVAHEVRNPLFAIQSITQILEGEIESAEHQTLIKALLKETYRMKNLIEELLLYSKPSRLNLSEVDLAKLLAEVKGYVRAKDETVIVSAEVPASSTVRADRDKLIQVLLNLVNNALGAGSKRLTISVTGGERSTVLALEDDGSGIRKEHMESIFDPFFTTKREGTGLGLPICRKIVEDHGGTIEIRSEEGRGTTAFVTFAA